MVEGYNALSPLGENLEKLFPMLNAIVDLIASFTEGTSVDVSKYINALKFDSGVRPLYEGDRMAINGLLSRFNTLTGIESDTAMGAFANTAIDYFVDNKVKAERALQNAAVMGGGFRAFGSRGGTIGDSMSGWDSASLGRYDQALTTTMADVWMLRPDDNVSKGERQMLFAQMMGGDTTMVRQNTQARRLMDRAELSSFFNDKDPDKWRNFLIDFDERVSRRNDRIRETREALVSEIGGLNTPEQEARMSEISAIDEKYSGISAVDEELRKLVTQIVRSQDALREFGAAASDWGKMLKTDASTAVSRVSDMMGINVAGAFSGSEFGYMTHMIQNAAVLSGNSTERLMNMSGVAQKQLSAAGLTADASMAIATVSAVSSITGNDYRNTKNTSEAMDIYANSRMLSSDAGTILRGTYQYMVNNSGGKSREQVYNELMQSYNANRGDLLAWAQNITGNSDMGMSDLMALSRDYDALEMAALHPEMMVDMGRKAISDTLDQVMAGRVTRDGADMRSEYDRLSAITREQAGMDLATVYNTMNSDRIKELFGESLGTELLSFRSDFNQVLKSRQEQGLFGEGARKLTDTSSTMRLLSENRMRDTTVRMKQAEIRSEIQREYASGGFFRTLVNMARENKDVTLGDLVSAVTGLTLSPTTVDFLSSASIGADQREILASAFSSKDGNDRKYESLFVSGIQAFNDLVDDGVAKDKALKVSGLTSFGFVLDKEGNLAFQGDKKSIAKDAKALDDKRKADDASASAARTKFIEGMELKDDASLEQRMAAARRLALYDVWAGKAKYGEEVYSTEQQKALNNLKDAAIQTNATQEIIQTAESNFRQAFKSDTSMDDAMARAKKDLGVETSGSAMSQMILSNLSKIAQRLLGGEEFNVKIIGGTGGN